MLWVLLGLLALLLVPAAIGLARATELFKVKADGGELRLVRGRLPQALFDDLADVARESALDGAEIRAVREGGQARVIAEGVNDGALQQIRNVVGRFPIQRIRTGQLDARTARAQSLRLAATGTTDTNDDVP